jgi:hypothetical protein
MLICLGAIAAVWALRERPADAVVSVRNRLIGIAAGALLSMFTAVAGSTMMRRAPVHAAAAQRQNTASASQDAATGSTFVAAVYHDDRRSTGRRLVPEVAMVSEEKK